MAPADSGRAAPATSAWAAYRHCRLCPRECGVDRVHGQRGHCGQGARCRLAAWGAHGGEEPSISGSMGSGTLFFSGCGSGCFFCQNHQISRGGVGRNIGPAALRSLVHDLVARGVHNLNFVSADHFWPHVRWLCERLRTDGVRPPFVYNSSGYHRIADVERLAVWMDVFLPDVKFADAGLAQRCMGDPRYPDLALAAVEAMVQAKGFLTPFDPSGRTTARQGVLVRHLVLPGCESDSRRLLYRLRERFGRHLPLSLMSQFTPTPACHARGQFVRPVDPTAYRRVCDLAARLGFEQVYIQPDCGDGAFLPDFTRPHPFAGSPAVRALAAAPGVR